MPSSLLQHRLKRLDQQIDKPVSATMDFGEASVMNSLQKSILKPEQWNNPVPIVTVLSYLIGGRRVRFAKEEGEFYSENLFFGHLASPYRTQNAVHICIVVRGQLTKWMMGTECTLHQGDAVLVGAGCSHCELVKPEDAVVVYVNVNQSFLEQYTLSHDNEIDRFLAKSLLSQPKQCLLLREIAEMDEVESLLELLLREAVRDTADRTQMELLLFRRFSHCVNRTEKKEWLYFDGMDREDIVFDGISRYMRNHLDTVSAQELERVFFYNRNFYNQLIQLKTGYSFIQYLQQLKMDHAKHLLETTKLSMDEISAQIGYSNRSHFYAMFRQKNGMTPNEYRRVKNAEK